MEKALEKESERGLQVEQSVDEGQQEEADQGNAATAEQMPESEEASNTPTLDAFAESQAVEEAPAPEVEGGFSAGGQDSSAPSDTGGAPASVGGGGGGDGGGAPESPTITALDASGEGAEPFDAFSESTSSQQADWWTDLDSDLGESMVEEESAFQEGLPVFHAVMSGEDPSGGKAEALPTVAANLGGMDQGGGEVPDAAIAETQSLGSSDVEAGSLSGFGAEGGDNAAAIGAAMSAIPTRDGSVQTSPGPPPNVPLAGDADPALVGTQMSEGLTQAATAQQEAMAAVAASPGPELVQPLAMNEEMSLQGIVPATPMPDEGEVGGMLEFQELGLSSDVVGAFDELNSDEMQSHLDTAASEMDAASVQRDADRTTALDQADADAQSMITDAHDQQTAMVAEQRATIDAKRQETVQAQADAVAGVQSEASSRHASVTGDIESRVAADQARVASEFESAGSKASSEVAKGEAKAEAEKRKAEKEAEEDDGGWFSAAIDFVASAIDAVASAIGSIFDAVRSAVTSILDGVKALANSIIDAAVSFVTAAISAFGDFLKGAIQGLLGDVFPGLADALCSAVDAVVDYANEKVTALGESMKEGFAALCDGLAAGINAVLDVYEAAVQGALAVAKAVATGDWKEALMMALQAALKLAGINEEEFFAMVGKGEDAIMSIINDPGGFLSNCIDAVALGFGNFADNFLEHLQTGFIEWLTGSVGEAGIVMPPELNMAGILDITMQVLGLSYDMLREKAVDNLGEDNVALMEEVWGFIDAAISGGLSGLWEHVQGYLDGLWDAVIGGIQAFLMEKIIVAAVTKLASMFNPVGAIVQALMAAWDLYCWARDQMQRIYGVVSAFVESMSDMATGNIDPAANKIEGSLADLVPVAIDLLASILGLGGISEKVKGVIEGVQQMVSDAIDAMIEKVKGMFPGAGDEDEAEAEGEEEAADEERSKYGGADAPESALANVVNSMPVPEIMGDDQGHTAHLTASGQVILTSTPTVAKPEHEGALRAQLEGDATGEVFIDPRSTLDEAGEYGKFKADFQRIAEEVGLSAADSEAERIWMLAVELCQSVNAAAAGAPSYADREGVEIPAGQEEESKKRKDLQSATFQKIIKEFQPLIDGFSEYMEAWDTMCQNTQWAFWSGQPGMAMATKHMGGRALEASPIGQAFNSCRIPGHDNFQLWPALSTAYAKFAGENIAEREYHGFLGRGAGVEASVWNMIEQPILVEMAGEQRQEVPQVRWHACKGMDDAPSTIDESVSGGDNGWVGTIDSSDDRAAMVALAELETTEQSQDGAEGDSKDQAFFKNIEEVHGKSFLDHIKSLFGMDSEPAADVLGLNSPEDNVTKIDTSDIGTNPKRTAMLGAAVEDALGMVTRAKNNVNKENDVYKEYMDAGLPVITMGSPDSRANHVEAGFAAIEKALIEDTITFKKWENGKGFKKRTTFAYVYPGRPGNDIYVGGAFWRAATDGIDSKAGTIVHELSHIHHGTSDHTYGEEASKESAKKTPHVAVKNADNYEHFSESSK